MTLWQALKQYPPYYVRLLAKESGGGRGQLAISDAQLAIRCNMPLFRLREIKELTSWESVTVDEMKRFFAGCNFDPSKGSDRARIIRYQWLIQKRQTCPFQYLRRHPKWESEFLPLVKVYTRHQANLTTAPAAA